MILPDLEILEQVKAQYSDEYLKIINQKMKVNDLAEFAEFRHNIGILGAAYLTFLRNNKDRLQPHARDKLFDDYSSALKRVKELYSEIMEDNPARAKFHETLRAVYLEQPQHLQTMFEPYQNAQGYEHEIFVQFIDVLASTSQAAKDKFIGSENSKLEGNALAWWVGSMGIVWPKGSAIPFKLGSYSKDAQAYKNSAIPLLHLLIKKLDATNDKAIATAMRKAVIKGQLIHPTKLLLG